MLIGRPDFVRNLFYILELPGYMGLLTCVVALVFGEYLALVPFFGVALLTIGPSWMLIHWLKGKGSSKIKYPLSLIALSYGVVSLIGALPLYAVAALYAAEGAASADLLSLCSPMNALFESFSGFTSSGLSMISDATEIPHTVQFWRSLSQWIGGLGIFILAVFVFSPRDEGTKKLLKTEVGNIFSEEKKPHLIRGIWLIYIGFTVLGFLLFLLAGQPVWVSLNHALTAVSTGGFSITYNSLQYQPLEAKVYTMLLMTLGALGFSMYWSLFYKRNLRAILDHRENLWFLLLLLLGIAALSAESLLSARAPDLLDNVFQWVSALTTTGYQTADISNWESWRVFLLALAMLVGGVGGSTAGGLKIHRMLLLFYTMRYTLSGRENEGFRNAIEYYGEGDSRAEIFSNFITLLGLWLMVLTLSVLVISWVLADEYALVEVMFEVISAQSNAGLSVGITSADVHWLVKSNLILLMWMGRLELIAIILLFRGLLPIGHR